MTILDALPAPVVTWGLVSRAIGALFVLAHLSLIVQVIPLCGARAVNSVAERLRATQRAFPGWRRFVDAPTLLWLNASDAALRFWCVAGIAGGLCGVYGGAVGGVGVAIAWLAYLSLADAAGLTFPWDVLLLECGFLSCFLPRALPLIDVSAPGDAHVALEHAPSALLAFAFQFLVARLMWGFAKVKFIGTKKGDDLYLKPFLIWLPVPNPIGWYLHHAPNWFHRLSLRFMFVAEVIAPGLLLVPGVPRLVGAALLVALMLGIHATGNWGFFNIGYALLCLTALDTATSARRIFDDPHGAWPDVVLFVYVALAALQLALFNTWVSRVWSYWPIVDTLETRHPWTRLIFAPLRFLSTARLVNGYGVFPANSWPPLRLTPVFEGSDDGVEWKRYPYRFLPTAAVDRPPVVAPHHPRIDQIMIYVAGGLHDTSLMSGLLGAALPVITYGRTNLMERILERILEGDARALGLFRADPFAGRAPKLGRVSAVALTATSLEEHRRSGDWWHARRVGSLVPATERNPEVLVDVLPVPELFHPDAVVWKKRAPSLRAMVAAWRAGTDLRLALTSGTDLDVDAMWSTYAPRIRAAVDGADAHAAGRLIEAELPLAVRRNGERVLERFAWLLRTALEPHRALGVEPKIPRMPNFRFHLAVCLLVLEGEERVRAWLAHPADAVPKLVAQATKERTLALLCAMRPRAVEATTHAFRWVIGNEIAQPGGRAPSVLEYFDLIAARTPLDEEWRPRATRGADGDWTIERDPHAP